ncbi:bacteriohemerythrin [Thalassotalea psychrophila]|uniref:Bacteriohemerythrin n=1 Tax=Thalassotalea psychrophila TaxID=3065647 RepID=A0ABY9TVU8_9GAMM|nr:bacteriohemerythrin [Colwelliaceae bacterium SQ149]
MTNRYKALIYAALIGLITVSIFLGFLIGFDNKISWLLVALLIIIPWIYNKNKQNKIIKWKAEYTVGVKSLDLDHQKLITLLNQFNTAYDYDMGHAFEHQSLKDLIAYTEYHFTREEQMMADSNYPDLVEHKQQHQIMIDKIKQIEKKYEDVGHDAFQEVSEFLSGWLINHINGTDKQYTEHLNRNGIS